MKHVARTLKTFLIIAFATLSAPAGAQTVEGVAAIVNDEVISQYDVRQRMRLILATTGVRPTEELLLRIQEQALDSLIDERLQLQQAREFEVDIEQAEIDEAMADLAQQNNISPSEIRTSLAQAGVDARTLEDQLRAEIAWQILVSGRYRPRLRVSNDQIDQMLQRMADSMSKPQYLISEILLSPAPGASEEQVQTAVDGVVQQLDQGAQFAAVAREVSSAASALDGGDVGWVRSGEILTEIENQLAAMQVGAISPPIHTQDGIFIIALRDQRSGSDPERVSLMQILAPVDVASAPESAVAEAERALQRATRRIDSCSDLDRVQRDVDGAVVSDLGTMAPSDLAPEYRALITPLNPGEVSDALRAPAGVVMLALCSRDRTGGSDLPSRDQIEARLLDQQLSQASRRWLRDLRRDATIETRVGP